MGTLENFFMYTIFSIVSQIPYIQVITAIFTWPCTYIIMACMGKLEPVYLMIVIYNVIYMLTAAMQLFFSHSSNAIGNTWSKFKFESKFESQTKGREFQVIYQAIALIAADKCLTLAAIGRGIF